MALKFADTAKPMGLFPVAEAVDIELTKKDDTKKSLQAMYEDGELGGGGTSTDQYSTEETLTNKVWIDGKPIYRKVLTLDISTTGGHNINVASLNIAQITAFKGIFNDTQYNYMFPVPDYGDGDTRFYLSYNIADKLIHYETGAKYGIKGKLIVTIEYTKTTN